MCGMWLRLAQESKLSAMIVRTEIYVAVLQQLKDVL